MQFKILLLASFVDKNILHKFLYTLKEKYGVNTDSVFIFDMNEDVYLLTYKIKVDVGNKFDIKKELHKTIQIHKKGSTFFTINALNKLIDIESGLSVGNISHKEYKIDWDQYKNKIILLRGDKLEITDISRVFLPKT